MNVSLRVLAAAASGFGGLLFQVAILRRFALVLGSSAIATALVLGVFLLGLGVGSWWSHTTSRVRARTANGVFGYAAVGVGILLAEQLTAAIGGLPPLLGGMWALVLVGIPCAGMGYAFPQLFVALDSGRASALVLVANLGGAVLGSWLAGNHTIPEWGMATTLHAAGAAYLLAAILIAPVRAGSRTLLEFDPLVPPDPVQTFAGDRLAFASGFLILCHELLLARRLPFWLEGFQPTLSGVLVAVLLASTLGAVAVTLLPTRWRTLSTASMGLLVAAIGMVLGIHEHTALSIARWEIRDDFGYHLRILAAAGLAAAPVAVFAGIAVPALIASPIDGDADVGERTRRAARAYLASGLGSAAAIGLGWFATTSAPSGFFQVVPLVAALVTIALVPGVPIVRASIALLVLVLAFGGAAGIGTPFEPVPPVVGSRYYHPDRMRVLAHATDQVTTASVVYDRSQHSMVLFTDEFRAAWVGPGTSYMKVLGHLPFLLGERLDDVAIIALGTGTTADAVCAWSTPKSIDVVEISSAVLSLADHFAADGPVVGNARATFRLDPRVTVHVEDGRRYIATKADRSLDLVTMEPLLPYAPGTAALYSREFYSEAARVLRDGGLCVQWVPTHAMPQSIFRTLLLTFGDAFPFTSVWLLDQSTLLVGSSRPHLPDAAVVAARWSVASDHAVTTLHEAGLASVSDLAAAFVGVLVEDAIEAAPRLFDDRPFLERIGYWSGLERLSFYSNNLSVLLGLVGQTPASTGTAWPDGVDWDTLRRARLSSLMDVDRARWSADAAAVATAAGSSAAVHGRWPRSVLLHQESQRARRPMQERALLERGLSSSAAIARRVTELDPGCAVAWAASSLVGDENERQRRREIALALDPVLRSRVADVALQGADWDPPAVTPLEDLGILAAGGELATKASSPTANGVALRAAWPVRVAAGFAALASQRDLRDEELRAVQGVLDPASLDRLCDAYGHRDGELLAALTTLWRPDLPPPSRLAALVGDAPDRKVILASLLAGRRSAESAELMAPLLVDGDRNVRRAAAVALQRSHGERIPYDPDGDEEQRSRAAADLRALHNRQP